ncbi:MAG: hypothetical protein NVSMB56_15200 [Pyrinomonadaceae bacterium]
MSDFKTRTHRTSPFINVTPLIDVLLVLLIIFMVITPLKPARFKAQIPQPPPPINATTPDIDSLVVSIDRDLQIKLNNEGFGGVDNTSRLNTKLALIFAERRKNRAFRADAILRDDLAEDMRVEKTVFIKAVRAIEYGAVARVIDGIKGAGANPVGLQIDDLE